ncbi:MAG: ferrochelatase [Actinomycetaceae bacterium]
MTPAAAEHRTDVGGNADPLAPYDAVLFMSFGGPEAPEDVVPFLRRVTAGRGIPDERLEEVGEHYYLFGGKSPINDLNLAMLADLTAELRARGIDAPIHWGNRNWDPDGIDVLRRMYDDGARRVLMIVTSAYGSYSGCRQYRQDVGRYVPELVAEGRPVVIDKVRPYFNDPGFVEANVDAVVDSMRELGGEPHLMFVTHSIPDAMELASGRMTPASYAEQHEEVARLVAAAAGSRLGRELTYSLTYCSRSGSPHTPWLEPDVNDALEQFAADGGTSVVVSPIGFISDHMEVAYDLDTEAKETAENLGLGFARAATAGPHPAFISGLVDLLLDRAAEARGVPENGEGRRRVVGSYPAWASECAVGCCAVRDGFDDGKLALCAAPGDVVTPR